MRVSCRLAICCVAVLAMLSGAETRAEPAFTSIVVLGDSLSDIGNAGRYSDGPVWVEALAAALDIPLRPSRAGGSNFAVGGARLDPGSGPTSLPAQAELHLARSRAPGRTLHVVYGGGNDVLGAVGTANAEAAVDAAASALLRIARALADGGATDLLIPNLPDVGMTPSMQGRGPAVVAAARTLSERFNTGVEAVWRDAEARRRGSVKIHRFDVHALAERVRQDPHAFGFADIGQPCPGSGQCAGFLFWDGIHPTAQAHARLAEAALGALRLAPAP